MAARKGNVNHGQSTSSLVRWGLAEDQHNRGETSSPWAPAIEPEFLYWLVEVGRQHEPTIFQLKIKARQTYMDTFRISGFQWISDMKQQITQRNFG